MERSNDKISIKESGREPMGTGQAHMDAGSGWRWGLPVGGLYPWCYTRAAGRALLFRWQSSFFLVSFHLRPTRG